MNKTKIVVLILSVLLITSCFFNKVADYDKDTAYKIIEVSKRVDLFYMNLLETEPSERIYNKFSEEYKIIEVELRSLVMMNQMRPKNAESTLIAKHILQNWLEFKAQHKENDSYKDSMIDVDWGTIREQFIALAVAEAAKQ